VDLSWSSAIEDGALRKQIVEELLNEGKLTGAEYYCITAQDRYRLPLYGLEDEKTHRENLLRLQSLTASRGQVIAVVEKMRARTALLGKEYFNSRLADFEVLTEKYRTGRISTRKYYGLLKKHAEKLGIDIYGYRNFAIFTELQAKARSLRYGRASEELKGLIVVLRQRLPYAEYAAFLGTTGEVSRMEDLLSGAENLSRRCGIDLERHYPALNRLLAYREKSKALNPLQLLSEEKLLRREIGARLCGKDGEREILFIQEFLRYLDDYCNTKIAADDHEYFVRNLDRFRLLWEKYNGTAELLALEPCLDSLHEYYEVNLARNNYFVENILKEGAVTGPVEGSGGRGRDIEQVVASLKDAGEIVIAVTGGFHTQGFTRLLGEKHVSYIVISPNVTVDTVFSDARYQQILEEEVRYMSQTLALRALSQDPYDEQALDLAQTSFRVLESRQIPADKIEKGINVILKILADKKDIQGKLLSVRIEERSKGHLNILVYKEGKQIRRFEYRNGAFLYVDGVNGVGDKKKGAAFHDVVVSWLKGLQQREKDEFATRSREAGFSLAGMDGLPLEKKIELIAELDLKDRESAGEAWNEAFDFVEYYRGSLENFNAKLAADQGVTERLTLREILARWTDTSSSAFRAATPIKRLYFGGLRTMLPRRIKNASRAMVNAAPANVRRTMLTLFTQRLKDFGWDQAFAAWLGTEDFEIVEVSDVSIGRVLYRVKVRTVTSSGNEEFREAILRVREPGSYTLENEVLYTQLQKDMLKTDTKGGAFLFRNPMYEKEPGDLDIVIEPVFSGISGTDVVSRALDAGDQNALEQLSLALFDHFALESILGLNDARFGNKFILTDGGTLRNVASFDIGYFLEEQNYPWFLEDVRWGITGLNLELMLNRFRDESQRIRFLNELDLRYRRWWSDVETRKALIEEEIRRFYPDAVAGQRIAVLEAHLKQGPDRYLRQLYTAALVDHRTREIYQKYLKKVLSEKPAQVPATVEIAGQKIDRDRLKDYAFGSGEAMRNAVDMMEIFRGILDDSVIAASRIKGRIPWSKMAKTIEALLTDTLGREEAQELRDELSLLNDESEFLMNELASRQEARDLETVLGNIKEGNILQIGFTNGALLEALHERYPESRLVLIDDDPRLLRQVKRHYPFVETFFRYVEGEWGDLDKFTGLFDTVLLTDNRGIPRVRSMLSSRVRGLLKPDGRALIAEHAQNALTAAFGAVIDAIEPHLNAGPDVVPRGMKLVARAGTDKDALLVIEKQESRSAVERRLEPEYWVDSLVVGSGIAGLSAAIESAARGKKVAVVTKGKIRDANTAYAQGGIAGITHEQLASGGDSLDLHENDTFAAGDNLYDEKDREAVRIMVAEAPDRLRELIAMGVKFDRDEKGNIILGREGAHSRNRILHTRDHTGQEIERVLAEKVRATDGIELLERVQVTELLVKDGVAYGVRAIDSETGRPVTVYAKNTLLATGGLGQVYAHTTNPPFATGDGVALAYRKGADVKDVELVQFHPTALPQQDGKSVIPNMPLNFLITEAARGEGARLLNVNGERFMGKYDPQWWETASRDIVSRAIWQEMQETQSDHVLIDLRYIHADGDVREYIRTRFPTIYARSIELGYDPTREPVPISPVAHYAMGGIKTDTRGRTNIKNLYAAGESASSGVQGANRLASNSLLEGLVFGHRAAIDMSSSSEADMSDDAGFRNFVADQFPPLNEKVPKVVQSPELERLKKAVQNVMWRSAGIIRRENDLLSGRAELSRIADELQGLPESVEKYEVENLITNAQLIVEGALQRRESVGAHFRKDSIPGTDRDEHIIQNNEPFDLYQDIVALSHNLPVLYQAAREAGALANAGVTDEIADLSVRTASWLVQLFTPAADAGKKNRARDILVKAIAREAKGFVKDKKEMLGNNKVKVAVQVSDNPLLIGVDAWALATTAYDEDKGILTLYVHTALLQALENETASDRDFLIERLVAHEIDEYLALHQKDPAFNHYMAEHRDLKLSIDVYHDYLVNELHDFGQAILLGFGQDAAANAELYKSSLPHAADVTSGGDWGYLQYLRRQVNPEGSGAGKTVFYPGSGSDIMYSAWATDADVYVFADKRRFLPGQDFPQPMDKKSYLNEKLTVGYSSRGSLGDVWTPLVWELEALGATKISKPAVRAEWSEERNKAYEVTFMLEGRPRRILYFEVDDAHRKDGLPEKLREFLKEYSVDIFITKAFEFLNPKLPPSVLKDIIEGLSDGGMVLTDDDDLLKKSGPLEVVQDRYPGRGNTRWGYNEPKWSGKGALMYRKTGSGEGKTRLRLEAGRTVAPSRARKEIALPHIPGFSLGKDQDYLRYLRAKVNPRAEQKTVFYLGSGADIMYPVWAADGDTFILADRVPFYPEPGKELWEPAMEVIAEKYFAAKMDDGFSYEDVLTSIGYTWAPLKWELERLGASDISEPIENSEWSEAGNKAYEITFKLDERDRHLLYFELKDAADAENYPPKLLKLLTTRGIDVFVRKAFMLVSIPQQVRTTIVNSLNKGGMILTDYGREFKHSGLEPVKNEFTGAGMKWGYNNDGKIGVEMYQKQGSHAAEGNSDSPNAMANIVALSHNLPVLYQAAREAGALATAGVTDEIADLSVRTASWLVQLFTPAADSTVKNRYHDILLKDIARTAKDIAEEKLHDETVKVAMRVSDNPQLIQKDAWALATTAFDAEHGILTLYVHTALLQALENEPAFKRDHLIYLLVVHEIDEYLALHQKDRGFNKYIAHHPGLQPSAETYHDYVSNVLQDEDQKVLLSFGRDAAENVELYKDSLPHALDIDSGGDWGYLQYIRSQVNPEGSGEGKTVFYPGSGSDIMYAAWATDADVFVFADQLKFLPAPGWKLPEEVSREKYLGDKAVNGYSYAADLSLIGNIWTPLRWELEGLGATGISEPAISAEWSGKASTAYEVTFSLQGRPRRILYFEVKNAKFEEDYPQKLREFIDTYYIDIFMTKAFEYYDGALPRKIVNSIIESLPDEGKVLTDDENMIGDSDGLEIIEDKFIRRDDQVRWGYQDGGDTGALIYRKKGGVEGKARLRLEAGKAAASLHARKKISLPHVSGFLLGKYQEYLRYIRSKVNPEGEGKTLFYLGSGPDIMYAYLSSDADTYVFADQRELLPESGKVSEKPEAMKNEYLKSKVRDSYSTLGFLDVLVYMWIPMKWELEALGATDITGPVVSAEWSGQKRKAYEITFTLDGRERKILYFEMKDARKARNYPPRLLTYLKTQGIDIFMNKAFEDIRIPPSIFGRIIGSLRFGGSIITDNAKLVKLRSFVKKGKYLKLVEDNYDGRGKKLWGYGERGAIIYRVEAKAGAAVLRRIKEKAGTTFAGSKEYVKGFRIHAVRKRHNELAGKIYVLLEDGLSLSGREKRERNRRATALSGAGAQPLVIAPLPLGRGTRDLLPAGSVDLDIDGNRILVRLLAGAEDGKLPAIYVEGIQGAAERLAQGKDGAAAAMQSILMAKAVPAVLEKIKDDPQTRKILKVMGLGAVVNAAPAVIETARADAVSLLAADKALEGVAVVYRQSGFSAGAHNDLQLSVKGQALPAGAAVPSAAAGKADHILTGPALSEETLDTLAAIYRVKKAYQETSSAVRFETRLRVAQQHATSRNDAGIGTIPEVPAYLKEQKELGIDSVNIVDLLDPAHPLAVNEYLLGLAAVPEIAEDRALFAAVSAPQNETDVIQWEKVQARTADLLKGGYTIFKKGEKDSFFRKLIPWGDTRQDAFSQFRKENNAWLAHYASDQRADTKTALRREEHDYAQWNAYQQLAAVMKAAEQLDMRLHLTLTMNDAANQALVAAAAEQWVRFGFRGIRLDLRERTQLPDDEWFGRLKAALVKIDPGVELALLEPADEQRSRQVKAVADRYSLTPARAVAPENAAMMKDTDDEALELHTAGDGRIVIKTREELEALLSGLAGHRKVKYFSVGGGLFTGGPSDADLQSRDPLPGQRPLFRYEIAEVLRRLKAPLAGEETASEQYNKARTVGEKLQKELPALSGLRDEWKTLRALQIGPVATSASGFHGILQSYEKLRGNEQELARFGGSFFDSAKTVLKDLSAGNERQWLTASVEIDRLARWYNAADTDRRAALVAELAGFLEGISTAMLLADLRQKNPKEYENVNDARALKSVLLMADDAVNAALAIRHRGEESVSLVRGLQLLGRSEEASVVMNDIHSRIAAWKPGDNFDTMEEALWSLEAWAVYRQSEDGEQKPDAAVRAGAVRIMQAAVRFAADAPDGETAMRRAILARNALKIGEEEKFVYPALASDLQRLEAFISSREVNEEQALLAASLSHGLDTPVMAGKVRKVVAVKGNSAAGISDLLFTGALLRSDDRFTGTDIRAAFNTADAVLAVERSGERIPAKTAVQLISLYENYAPQQVPDLREGTRQIIDKTSEGLKHTITNISALLGAA
jgi:L-aspartate oxidase